MHTEVFANRLTKQRGFVGQTGWALQVDDQRQPRIGREIPGPLDDELLRSRIQVALAERGRIDGVEELPQPGHAYLDDLVLRRNRISGRRRGTCHRMCRPDRVAASDYEGTGAGGGNCAGGRGSPAAS